MVSFVSTVILYIFYIFLGIVPYSIFALAAYLAKKGAPPWIPRKVIHILGMTNIAIYVILFPSISAIFSILVVTLSITVILHFSRLKFVEWMARATSREGEHWLETVGNLTMTTIVLFGLYFYDRFYSEYYPSIFLTAIFSLAWGDGLAELVGRRFGRYKYKIIGEKSIEGSLTVFFMTFLSGVLSFFIPHGFHFFFFFPILVASVYAMVAEAISIKVLDNLLIPLGVQLTLWSLLI